MWPTPWELGLKIQVFPLLRPTSMLRLPRCLFLYFVNFEWACRWSFCLSLFFASTIVDMLYDTIILLMDLFTMSKYYLTVAKGCVGWSLEWFKMTTQGEVLWTYNLSDDFGLQNKDSDQLEVLCVVVVYRARRLLHVEARLSAFFKLMLPPCADATSDSYAFSLELPETWRKQEAGSRKHKIQQLVFVLLLPFFFYGGDNGPLIWGGGGGGAG